MLTVMFVLVPLMSVFRIPIFDRSLPAIVGALFEGVVVGGVGSGSGDGFRPKAFARLR
jgi:hypothetical protein